MSISYIGDHLIYNANSMSSEQSQNEKEVHQLGTSNEEPGPARSGHRCRGVAGRRDMEPGSMDRLDYGLGFREMLCRIRIRMYVSTSTELQLIAYILYSRYLEHQSRKKGVRHPLGDMV